MTSTTHTPPARLLRIAVASGLALLVSLGGSPARAEAASTKPSDVSATATGPTAVVVTWDAVKKAGGYRVKYSTSSKMSNPEYVKTTKTTATLSSLAASTTYYVKVRTTKASGKALSGYSSTVEVRTPAVEPSQPPTLPPPSGSAELRVASYNVTCDKCFDGQPNELHWSGRRAAVAKSIRDQDLDVVGVQEAGQGWLKDENGDKIDLSHFEDLRNALGGTWDLTNDARNNCVKSKSPNSCDYKDQGASDGTRIFYDTAKVKMLDSGSKLLPTNPDTNDRYVAWARLQQRSTGKQFMFATTQLEHTKDKSGPGPMQALRRDSAKVIASTVAKNNPDHLPALVVGDFNSSRFSHDYSPSNAPYDVLVDAGYVDPLGGAWRSTTTAPGALVKHRIHTWVNSFNGFERKVTRRDGWINGSYIDYIMVSKGISVPEWETVVKLDKDGDLDGIIPSDHNMIRASVVLPG